MPVWRSSVLDVGMDQPVDLGARAHHPLGQCMAAERRGVEPCDSSDFALSLSGHLEECLLDVGATVELTDG